MFTAMCHSTNQTNDVEPPEENRKKSNESNQQPLAEVTSPMLLTENPSQSLHERMDLNGA